MQANASAISTESTSRSQYKTSVYEESSIKFMKNACILRKIKCLALGLVTCARVQVTLLAENILHGVYSAFDTLFPSLLFTLDIIHKTVCIFFVIMRMRCWVRRCRWAGTTRDKDDAGESWSEGGSRLPSRALRRHRVSIQRDPADPLHG